MKVVLYLFLFIVGNAGGCCFTASGQRADLYDCEGCEAIHEHSFDDLTWTATIVDEDEPGEPLILTGNVYAVDGTTLAKDVIVYAYHTNAKGVYPKRGDEKGWARRHGYLRGWIKTDENGRYRFRTIKPGSYPGRTAPAHIHMTVKEPGTQEYWIEDVLFDDDPLVTDAVRKDRPNRGGPGIISLARTPEGTLVAVRDIILERHPD